jgi:hypothetical protein
MPEFADAEVVQPSGNQPHPPGLGKLLMQHQKVKGKRYSLYYSLLYPHFFVEAGRKANFWLLLKKVMPLLS